MNDNSRQISLPKEGTCGLSPLAPTELALLPPPLGLTYPATANLERTK
jgi:hypothetical protein